MLVDRCTYCLKRLKRILICCADCKNVYLCLFCFSHGVEAGHHRRSHRYSIKYNLDNDCDECILNGWPGSEELELLCAVEQYALGNWEDVAAKCNNRTPQECYEHYDNFYLHGPNASVWRGNSADSNTVKDHSSPLKPIKQEKPVQLEPIEQQLLGYMVMRDDFERDYDNDAESLLTRLNVRPDCDDLEKALHVAYVNIYTQRLQERQKRKEIGRLHGLIYQISAFLTYKKLKRKQSRHESKISFAHHHKVVPVSRSQKRKLTPQLSPTSPPAGSWLAAPFALQSSGPTRGIPVVVPGVVSLPQELACKSSDLDDYDPFNINEKLKPFLRYFTPMQAKQFLNNLHREEILKHEIKYLHNVLQKSLHRSSNSSRISSPLKGPSELRSQVYVPAPQNTEPIHPLLVDHPMFGVATTATTSTSVNSTEAMLSPRRSITAVLRSATAAAQQEAQRRTRPHRRRRRYRGSIPWYARASTTHKRK
ncbi:hypothetical protein Aperf_G00000096775 [Anoplocephala perfoliata]